MKICSSLLFIFLCYLIYSYITCIKSIRDSQYFLVSGSLCSLAAQISWMYLSRYLNNVNQILIYNTIKTALIILAGALAPIIFFHAKVNKYTILGMILIIIGSLLLKRE